MSRFSSSNDARVIGGEGIEGRWLGGPTLPLSLLAALMAAPLAMAVVDEAGFIIGWNEFATALLGWAPREVIGKGVEDTLLPPRLLPIYRDIRDGRPPDDPRIATRTFAMPLLASDGREVDAVVALASSVDLSRIVYVVYAWGAEDLAFGPSRKLAAGKAKATGGPPNQKSSMPAGEVQWRDLFSKSRFTLAPGRSSLDRPI